MNPIRVEIREAVTSLAEEVESYPLISTERPFEGRYGLYITMESGIQKHILDIDSNSSPQMIAVRDTDQRLKQIMDLGGLPGDAIIERLRTLSHYWIDEDDPLEMDHRHGETIAWIAAELCEEDFEEGDSEEIEDAKNTRSLIQSEGGFVYLMNTISHIGKWAANKFIEVAEGDPNADYYLFMEAFMELLRTGFSNFSTEFKEEFYRLSSETRMIQEFHNSLKTRQK